jgi:hypothetical protein
MDKRMTPLSFLRQMNTNSLGGFLPALIMIALCALGGACILFLPNAYIALLSAAIFLIGLTILYPAPCAFLAIGVIPFQQAFLGEEARAHISLSDALMVASLTGGAIRDPSIIRAWIRNTPIILWAYFLFLLISLVRRGDPVSGGLSLARMVLNTYAGLGVGYLLGSKRKGMKEGVSLYVVLCVFLSLLILYLSLIRGDAKANYPMELNKNAVGITIGCAIVILVAFIMERREGPVRVVLSLALGVCIAGISFSLSRGACLSTAFGVIAMAWLQRSVKTVLAVIICLSVLYIILLHFGSANVRSYALDFGEKSHSAKERIQSMSMNWRFFLESPLLGKGLGLRKETEPHNILLTTLSETGLIGLLFIIAVFYRGYWEIRQSITLYKADGMERSLMLCAAAVFLMALAHGMIDIYWRRGVGALAWALVGYAIALRHIGIEGSENEKQGSSPVCDADS